MNVHLNPSSPHFFRDMPRDILRIIIKLVERNFKDIGRLRSCDKFLNNFERYRLCYLQIKPLEFDTQLDDIKQFSPPTVNREINLEYSSYN